MNATTNCFPGTKAIGTDLPAFEFRGKGGILFAEGEPMPLAGGTRADLADRIAAGLAGQDGAVAAGAIPFLAGDADAFQVARVGRRAARQPGSALSGGATNGAAWDLREQPTGAEYAGAVTRALRLMAEGVAEPDGLRKIVLARSILVRAPAAIDLPAVLDRLSADPMVTAFLVRLPDVAGAARHLVGATPELLLSKTGARIASHPLAGSARRDGADPGADRAAAAALDTSEKDRREHRYVTELILDTLAPWCRSLGCPEGTVLTSTRSMWHLGTRIEGELRDPDTPSAVLAVALHPTPAVCGVPQDRAAAEIGRLELLPRGFYSGAVGWSDAKGDCDWFVTIRCAEVSGASARLYAGAGVVAGSDPEAERAETAAKFSALLAGLGLDTTGEQ